MHHTSFTLMLRHRTSS